MTTSKMGYERRNRRHIRLNWMNGKFGELANQTNKPSDNTHLRNDEFDFLKSVSIFFLESELGQAAEWERTQCNRCVRVQMCTVRCASNMNLFGKIVEYNHRKRKGGRANERTILWMHAIVVYVSEFSNTQNGWTARTCVLCTSFSALPPK